MTFMFVLSIESKVRLFPKADFFLIVNVETFGTAKISDNQIAALITSILTCARRDHP